MKADTTTQSLSVVFDAFLPGEDSPERKARYRQILTSIDLYRATAKKVFGMFALAQAAGATFEETKDGGLRVVGGKKGMPDAAKTILEAATGKSGKALAYELRDWVLQDLAPSWHSFVWDSLRADVQAKWTAPDPELATKGKKVGRGFLILNSARYPARMHHIGIGFPSAVLAKGALSGHNVTLKWDHNIGPVTFALGKLDGGRFYTWKNIRDGVWKHGTMFLKHRDGKLQLVVTYHRPQTEAAKTVNPDRVLYAHFGEQPGRFLRLYSEHRTRFHNDSLSCDGVLSWLDSLNRRREITETRKASYGNPRRDAWGHKKGWDHSVAVLDSISKQRENGCKDHNHCWSRRIIDDAVRWGCGRVVVVGIPETLFTRSWGWAQFRAFLDYKAKLNGIATQYEACKPGEPIGAEMGELLKELEERLGGPEEEPPEEFGLTIKPKRTRDGPQPPDLGAHLPGA